jgi:ParB family chromosome partitioning protein
MSDKFKQFDLGIKPVLTNDFFGKKDKKINETQTALIELSHVIPNPYQPRKTFDKASLQELTESIIANGLIQPIIVRKTSDKTYQLISGERRVEASRIAGFNEISAIVKEASDDQMLYWALVENIQRDDLNPIEEALAYQQLLQRFELSHEALGKQVGKSRTTITNAIRLLSLTDVIKDLLREKKLEMGHARALLTLSAAEQDRFANQIVTKGLNVRETEALVKARHDCSKEDKREKPYAEKITYWEKNFHQRLSTSVKVKLNEKGEGRVVFHVSSPEEVDWIYKKITEGKGKFTE